MEYRKDAGRALGPPILWLAFACLSTAAPVEGQAADGARISFGVGLGVGGVTAREGTVAGLDGSARFGLRLGPVRSRYS